MKEHIYLYYSKNSFFLDYAIEEKIQELKIDEFNIIKYDLMENSSFDILEDLQTISFFAEQKVIIVKNIDLINKESEATVKQWIGYFAKPNPDVVLIISLPEVLDTETPIGEALFKYAFIEKVKETERKNYCVFVKEMFDKRRYKITDDAIETLLTRTNADFNLLSQEAEKLMMYAHTAKSIVKDDVLALVTKNLEENIFELTNSLLNGDKAKTVEIFYDLIARSEEPLRILNNISNKVRQLIHAKLLLDKRYTQEQIAQHFHIKSGRAYYLIKNANSMKLDILESHIKKLAKLDYEIKSGKIDKKLGVELYLLGA